MKQYADTKRHAKAKAIQIGDMVLIRREGHRSNETAAPYDPEPYHVTRIKHSMITAERIGKQVTRHTSFFKVLKHYTPPPVDSDSDDFDVPLECDARTQYSAAAARTPQSAYPPSTSALARFCERLSNMCHCRTLKDYQRLKVT